MEIHPGRSYDDIRSQPYHSLYFIPSKEGRKEYSSGSLCDLSALGHYERVLCELVDFDLDCSGIGSFCCGDQQGTTTGGASWIYLLERPHGGKWICMTITTSAVEKG